MSISFVVARASGSTLSHTQLMGQGKRISEEVRWIIIRLGTTMTEEEVAMYANVSERTVHKILAHFKQTGSVEEPKQLIPRAHQVLCEYDIQVRIHSSIRKYLLTITITVSASHLEQHA